MSRFFLNPLRAVFPVAVAAVVGVTYRRTASTTLKFPTSRWICGGLLGLIGAGVFRQTVWPSEAEVNNENIFLSSILSLLKNDERRYVIISSGNDGKEAVESLRASGFTGSITLVSPASDLSAQEIEHLNVNTVASSSVEEIDTRRSFIQTSDHHHIHYDKLLILQHNSASLSSYRNEQKIEALRHKKVVIQGFSLEALDVALKAKSLFNDQVDVTLVDQAASPFENLFGEVVGKALLELSQRQGINYRFNASTEKVEQLKGKQTQKVVLKNGETFEADVLLLQSTIPHSINGDSVIEKSPFGQLKTSESLQTSDPKIFAATNNSPFVKTFYPQTSWQSPLKLLSQEQAAALNMRGEEKVIHQLMSFSTKVNDKYFESVGNFSQFDECLFARNEKDNTFAAWYFKENNVVGFAHFNIKSEVTNLTQMFARNIMPSPLDIKRGIVSLKDVQKVLDLAPYAESQ